MASTVHDKKISWIALGMLLSIPIIQLVVSRMITNNWGLSHWLYMPWWYGLLWTGVVAVATVSVWQLSQRLAGTAISGKLLILLSGVILALVILFSFDSFLFAAGNIRVAELAQRDYLIVRWFEYGSFLVVHFLYRLLTWLSIESDSAGVWAWRTLSFVASIAALTGAVKITGLLTKDQGRRVALFSILFFGPQVLPLFGFVGYSSAVTAVTIWFSYFAIRGLRRNTSLSLILAWCLVLVGVFLHSSLVYLVPAALFVTVATFTRSKNRHRVGAVTAGVVLAGMTTGLYIMAGSRLEWLVEILSISGKNPFGDYGLFSNRHLGDMLQLLVGYAPQVFLALILGISGPKSSKRDAGEVFAVVLAVSGLAVAFIIDPSNGIPSDIPILVSYLFGISLITAMLCKRLWSVSERPGFSPAVLSALVVGVLIGYLPAYVKISIADPYLTGYYDQHKEYYATACFAFRDAYFYRGNLEAANRWEQAVRYKSDYYINVTGVSNLIQSGDNQEALRTLGWVRSEFPYRPEPQQLTATAQLNLQRFSWAKPHIDTCFMLQPYAREHFQSLYIYYRDQQQYGEAIQTVNRALAIFRGDLDFTVDLLISHYRMGDYVTADSLCKVVLEIDANQPYPYLIRGLMAELGKALEMATINYRKFLDLAPNEPEAAYVRSRLDSLEMSANP